MAQTTLDQRMLGTTDQSTALTDHTITASDILTFADVGDSNLSKKDTVQGVLDLASGGGLKFVSKTDVAHDNSGDVEITGLTGYTAYKIFLVNLSNDNTSGTIDCQIANSGTTWITNTYHYAVGVANSGSSGHENDQNSTSASSWVIAGASLETGDYPLCGEFTLYRGLNNSDGNRTNNATVMIGRFSHWHNSNGRVYGQYFTGSQPATTADGCVSIKFYKTTGALQHGHIAVFGIAES